MQSQAMRRVAPKSALLAVMGILAGGLFLSGCHHHPDDHAPIIHTRAVRHTHVTHTVHSIYVTGLRISILLSDGQPLYLADGTYHHHRYDYAIIIRDGRAIALDGIPPGLWRASSNRGRRRGRPFRGGRFTVASIRIDGHHVYFVDLDDGHIRLPYGTYTNEFGDTIVIRKDHGFYDIGIRPIILERARTNRPRHRDWERHRDRGHDDHDHPDNSDRARGRDRGRDRDRDRGRDNDRDENAKDKKDKKDKADDNTRGRSGDAPGHDPAGPGNSENAPGRTGERPGRGKPSNSDQTETPVPLNRDDIYKKDPTAATTPAAGSQPTQSASPGQRQRGRDKKKPVTPAPAATPPTPARPATPAPAANPPKPPTPPAAAATPPTPPTPPATPAASDKKDEKKKDSDKKKTDKKDTKKKKKESSEDKKKDEEAKKKKKPSDS